MCHLRPVSTEIARLHCAIVTHPDGRVFLRDFGSPSGTMINRRTLIGGEFEIQDGDNLEIGPLKFRITLQRTSSTSPLIETKSHKKLPRTAPLALTFDGKSPVTEWEDQAAAVIPGDNSVGLLGHWGAQYTEQLAGAVQAARHVRVRVGTRDLGEYEIGRSGAAYQALLKCGRLLKAD